MAMKRLSSFLVTEVGQKALGVTAGVTCTLSAIAVLAPHWFLLEKYKEIVQLQRHGMPYLLPDKIEDIAEKELEISTFIPEDEKKNVEFFCVFGLDPFHAGSTDLTFGGIIGLPINFSYSSSTEIDKNLIQVNNKPVNWSSEAGKQLENSLILSKSAIKFAIQQEICYATYVYHFEAILPMLATSGTYTTCRSLNTYLQLLSRPRFMRFGLYGLVTGVWFAVWLGTRDLCRIVYDKMVVKMVAELGEDYVQGGIEFYSKMMQKNAALRVLLGPDGGNRYTAKGNINSFIRMKTLPLEQRLDSLKSALNKIEDQKEKLM